MASASLFVRTVVYDFNLHFILAISLRKDTFQSLSQIFHTIVDRNHNGPDWSMSFLRNRLIRGTAEHIGLLSRASIATPLALRTASSGLDLAKSRAETRTSPRASLRQPVQYSQEMRRLS